MTKSSDIALAGLAEIEKAIVMLLRDSSEEGLRNVDIGRRLGIYAGYAGGNEGHISRTALERLREAGAVVYDKGTHLWSLKEPGSGRS